MDEDVLRLISKQNNSNIFTYEKPPHFYSNKDISEAHYTIEYHEGTLQIENDDVGMNKKFVLTRFGGDFGILGFDENSFFKNF